MGYGLLNVISRNMLVPDCLVTIIYLSKHRIATELDHFSHYWTKV